MRSCIIRLSRFTAAMGLAALALSGCQPEAMDDPALSLDPLSAVNGLAMVNGLTMTNGLATGNGLTMTNGLSTSTGLASNMGLMTSAAGRVTVSYLVRCALPSGHSITKVDQSGASHTFSGQIGVAPAWETGACNTGCQEAVSACLMAHVNVAGVHVPLWLDSPIPAIGFGSNSSFPNEEGTFFGNLFVTGSGGKVAAYYCEGSGFAKGVVPGRLGASASASTNNSGSGSSSSGSGSVAGIFTNPFGAGALCSAKCKAAPSSAKGQGYASCDGYTSPITVWRAASYRPVFDPSYVYRLVNAQSQLAAEVAGASVADGAAVSQSASRGAANQEFKIVLKASSTWALTAVHSGKAIIGTGAGKGSAVTQKTFVNTPADLWGIDDHNGHFKIVNKSSTNALEIPGGNAKAGTSLETSSYTGALNQDWDIFAVVP